MKKHLLAGLLLLGTASASAELVYGVSSQSHLYETAGYETIWSQGAVSGENSYNLGSSAVGWDLYKAYFAADGVFYGVTSGNQLISGTSAEGLWDGVGLTNHGNSSAGWGWGSQYFANDGRYFAITGNGYFYEAASALDLWSGNYVRSWGTSAAGWGNAQRYFYNDEGLFGVTSGNVLLRFDGIEQLIAGTASQSYGTSSNGWDKNKQYFSEGDIGSVVVSTSYQQAQAAAVPAPAVLSVLALLGVAGWRRKRDA